MLEAVTLVLAAAVTPDPGVSDGSNGCAVLVTGTVAINPDHVWLADIVIVYVPLVWNLVTSVESAIFEKVCVDIKLAVAGELAASAFRLSPAWEVNVIEGKPVETHIRIRSPMATG
jgi:hypothetical protein